MKYILSTFLLVAISLNTFAGHEATVFGKITGIESRDWGFHIQTDFGAGASNGCAVKVTDTYMYDFEHANARNGESSLDEVSMLLAAYAAQSKIAFHIYRCNESNNRPTIGYIRLKN